MNKGDFIAAFLIVGIPIGLIVGVVALITFTVKIVWNS